MAQVQEPLCYMATALPQPPHALPTLLCLAPRKFKELRGNIATALSKGFQPCSIAHSCLRSCSRPARKFKELRGNIATALSKAFQRYLRPRNHMGSIEVRRDSTKGAPVLLFVIF